MRARILAFVQGLRARGVAVSVAETLDAVAAVAAAGVDRPELREALAATLVKDEAWRPAFDAFFDEAFPLVAADVAGKRRRARSRAGGSPGDVGGRGRGGGTSSAARQSPAVTPGAAASVNPPVAVRTAAERRPDGDRATTGEVSRDGEGTRHRRARRHELLARPFREFTSRDVVEARALVAALARQLRARLARRERQRRRGRIDIRRTIRAAIQTGGVPVRPRFRGRRPRRPDLVALCDLSGSVAAASELCLGLIAPAADYFRRVDLFVFVDHLCAVSIEDGHVAPAAPLDLHARSDFGRVLGDLWRTHAGLLHRGTVVVVLGDARNNRLPPRADLLRAVRERVQRLVWLVPEPRERWDTGDSVLGLYAPRCDAVVECVTLGALTRAVRRLFA